MGGPPRETLLAVPMGTQGPKRTEFPQRPSAWWGQIWEGPRGADSTASPNVPWAPLLVWQGTLSRMHINIKKN